MKKPNPDKMFKTFRSIAGYLILIIIILLLFEKQSDRTDELIKRIETQEKELKKQSDSLYSVFEQRNEKVIQAIENKKFTQTKVYNNYYENEKDFIDITDRTDSISWFVARRKFERRVIE